MTYAFFLASPVDGRRTRIVQDLLGMTQLEFSRLLGHRDDGRLVRYWQNESNRKDPSAASLEVIESKTGFAPHFFAPRETFRYDRPLFHKLTSASAATRRAARGYLHLAGDLAVALQQHDPDRLEPLMSLPPSTRPEVAAMQTRAALGVESDPLSDLVALLEANGVVVGEIGQRERAIYSLSGRPNDIPTILINPLAGDRYRLRFYTAHELGHLVLHAGLRIEGASEDLHGSDAEAVADEFAAAFLMPSEEIVDDLRRVAWSYYPWRRLADLKERWGVEMSSIVRRARALDVLDADTYRAIMVDYSARSMKFRRESRGDQRGEKHPDILIREPGSNPVVEQPRRLPSLLRAEIHGGIEGVASHLGVPDSYARTLFTQAV